MYNTTMTSAFIMVELLITALAIVGLLFVARSKQSSPEKRKDFVVRGLSIIAMIACGIIVATYLVIA